MAGTGNAHIIDITIQTHDRVGQGLQSAERSLNNFDRSIARTQRNLNQLTSHRYEAAVGINDRATPEVNRINSQLRSIASGSHNATVGLRDRVSSKLREIRSNVQALTSKTWQVIVEQKNKIGEQASGALRSATGLTGTMLAGAGITMGVADTINTFKDFEAQMSTVGSILGKTGTQMQGLTAKAKEMGATTSFSASEAGQAMQYMAMAGWDEGQITGGIKGLMDLAAASGESLGSVSDIVTDAMTAFGMGAEQSGRFADVLAKTASNANTNVAMMGETFKYVAPVAGSLKYSVEDVSLAIGLMANAGIKGSNAGTALRSTFTRLVDPPKEAAAQLAQLGIEAKNADGTMKPLNTMLKEMRAKFAGLSDAEKAEAASSIAGQEAMSGFLAMMNASEADFKKLETSIKNSKGAADEMAKIKMDNLAGDLKTLGSVWEAFQLQLMEGSGAGGGLRSFVQGTREELEKLTKYMKDGFDFSDIGHVAIDIITQLRKKFFEFDGVGSLLAGGVLAAGLIRITMLARKAIEAVKKIRMQPGPSGTGAGAGPGMGADLPGAKEMAITANTVIVNAKNMQQGGPGGAGSPGAANGPSGPGQTSRPGASTPVQTTPGGRWSQMKNTATANLKAGGWQAGGMTAAGAVVSGAMAYQDYKSTKEYNQQMTDEADFRYKTANDQLWERRQDYDKAKAAGASSEELETIQNDVMALENEKADAEADKKKTEEYNTLRENESVGRGVGSTVGTVLGGAVGTMLGGPAGTMIGSMIGESLGGIIGEFVGANWEDITAGVGGMIDYINEGFAGAAEVVSERAVGIGDSIKDGFSAIGEFIGEMVTSAGELIMAGWDAIGEGVSVVGETIGEAFTTAGELVTSTGEAIWTTMQTAWDNICQGVQIVGTAVGDAFSTAWATVQGIWAGAASWFESAVIGPIKSKFAAISDTVAGWLPGGGGGGGESQHASGGLFVSPHRAIIGEAGPEAVIPLSASSRGRGIELLERAAGMMGLQEIATEREPRESGPFAAGGLFGGISDGLELGGGPFGGILGNVFPGGIELGGLLGGSEQETAPGLEMPAPDDGKKQESAESGAPAIHIELGGISPQITINGGNSEEIVSAISQNLGRIADMVAGQISQQVTAIYSNQPAMA